MGDFIPLYLSWASGKGPRNERNFWKLKAVLIFGQTSEQIHGRHPQRLIKKSVTYYPGGMQSVSSSAYHRLSKNSFHSAVLQLPLPTTPAARNLYRAKHATDSPKIPFIPRSATSRFLPAQRREVCTELCTPPTLRKFPLFRGQQLLASYQHSGVKSVLSYARHRLSENSLYSAVSNFSLPTSTAA